MHCSQRWSKYECWWKHINKTALFFEFQTKEWGKKSLPLLGEREKEWLIEIWWDEGWWWPFVCLRGFGGLGKFDYPFPAYVFLFYVEISLRTVIPLFGPSSVHSSPASRDDCGRTFPDKLRVSLFPDKFPHCALAVILSAHSNFVWSRMYACLCVTCHMHFWQNDQVFYVPLW